MRRRRFLKFSLWGGAVVVASGAGLALWPSRVVYHPMRRLRVVDARGFNVLAQVAARVVAAGDADPVAIAHGVDEAVARGPAEAQADFRTLLALVENRLAGLILDGRGKNFTRLLPAEQDRALYAMRDSGLVARRSGYHALRKLCSAAYYAGPSTWEAIGYPGPPTIPEMP